MKARFPPTQPPIVPCYSYVPCPAVEIQIIYDKNILSILALLSFLAKDEEVSVILSVWASIYFIDVVVGTLISSTYPLYFLHSLINSIAVVTVTLGIIRNYHKALIIFLLWYLDASIATYEIVVGWSESIYPHLSTISWWVIELQVLTLIYNIQFKAPRKL